MRFRAFPKVWTTLADAPAASPDGIWVALEKIHRAQLVIGLDGAKAISLGKRKAWLADAEPFFGWQLIRHQLASSARTVRRELDCAGLGQA